MTHTHRLSDDGYTVGSTFWTSGNGFFNAVGMELVAGTGFVQDLWAPDTGGYPVVINQSMAEAAFPQRATTTLTGEHVTVAASWGPARRATSISPMEALRGE